MTKQKCRCEKEAVHKFRVQIQVLCGGGGGGRRGYDTRAELLKQQCHTGKVASNIHRLGPKNTQKVANELKNNCSIHWQLFVFFWAQPVYVASYFSCVTLLLQ